SPLYPVQIPDLIGVADRRYLDRTGLQRHRSIADLMRYAAMNRGILNGGDGVASHDGFVPGDPPRFEHVPDPSTRARYSDEQLYALAQYLYALRPPANPNAVDAAAVRGGEVFRREGCVTCHTPPLYTNNTLTPADGFTIPVDHPRRYDVTPLSVGTDPALTLETRRGTGYYKVPSLKGVWYRGMFGHSGWCATLEDWFDPRRVRDDYVPSGFKPHDRRTFAVVGHRFGLNLSEEDRRALIRFLNTL
ncbi:MAG TPA: di-heme oxidoredictase family protein, partial [Vicinamibacterales bacterium]|nr:di-heme oxidoredictase family protein [Vicinamibacterales bacterium]